METVKIITLCDIDGCHKLINVDGKSVPKTKIQTIFTTEQTEGRSVKPYLSTEQIHICTECYEKVLQGNAIFGQGAMGHNKFWFEDKK